MKRFLLLTALTLSGLISSAKDAAETKDLEIAFTITPRFDISPYFSAQSDGENSFSFGNSSLYTSFIGDINKHWSFMLVNHWLGNNPNYTFLYSDTHYLYDNTLRTDDINWLDFCNITYAVKGFSFTFGKDMITTGGFEYDNWDWENHPEQMSGLWINLPAYQWGGKISWTTPSENTTVGIQMTTSPYPDPNFEDENSWKPFKSGRYNYSLSWLGDFNWFHTNISLTAFQRYDWSYNWLAAAGLRFTPGQFTIDANWFNKVGRTGTDDYILADGNTGTLFLTYTAPSEKFDFSVKGGIERVRNSDEELRYNNTFAGLSVNWYPVFASDIFRVHGAVSYNSFGGCVNVTVGFLANLDIISLIW